MKLHYILASCVVVCFGAPNSNKKITNENLDIANNLAKEKTRNAVNWLNGLLAQGEHTKDLKAGQLIHQVLNIANKNPAVKKFAKGFKPAEESNKPKITTAQYLNNLQNAGNQICQNNKVCKDTVTASIKQLRKQARQQRMMQKPVSDSMMNQINKAIPGLAA